MKKKRKKETKRPNPFFSPAVKHKSYVPLCTQTNLPLLSSYSSCLQRENKYETKPQSRMLEPHSTFCKSISDQLLFFWVITVSPLLCSRFWSLLSLTAMKKNMFKKIIKKKIYTQIVAMGPIIQEQIPFWILRVHHRPGTILSVGPLQPTMTFTCLWMHFQISPKCPLLWSSWKHQPIGDFSPFTAAKEHSDEYSLNMGSAEGEREENNLYWTKWHCPSRCFMWSLKAQL